MRKQAGLAVDAKIVASVVITDERIAGLVEQQNAVIAGEVRAEVLTIRFAESSDAEDTEWDIDGLKVFISIVPIN